MCLRFAFLLITQVAAWLRLSRRKEAWKTAEILMLRHQLAVLQRQSPGRPKLDWADRPARGPADGQVLRARRILVATGVRDELPDIPGVRQRWGQDLLHCPYCHGWEARDQPIAVLGTQPGSVQHAQLVRQWSDDVVFFVHTYALTSAERVQLEACGVRVLSDEVTRLVVEADWLTGVELADGRVIARTAVFILTWCKRMLNARWMTTTPLAARSPPRRRPASAGPCSAITGMGSSPSFPASSILMA